MTFPNTGGNPIKEIMSYKSINLQEWNLNLDHNNQITHRISATKVFYDKIYFIGMPLVRSFFLMLSRLKEQIGLYMIWLSLKAYT